MPALSAPYLIKYLLDNDQTWYSGCHYIVDNSFVYVQNLLNFAPMGHLCFENISWEGGRHMLSKQKTYIIIYIKKLIKYCKLNTPTLEAFECVRKINPGISIFASLAKKDRRAPFLARHGTYMLGEKTYKIKENVCRLCINWGGGCLYSKGLP